MLERRITLGLDLDSTAARPGNSLGALVVGISGLLRHLEIEIGLAGELSASERILAAEDALRETNAPERFFHRSFEISPLACARTILSLRDELLLSGADLEALKGQRLEDLRAIERTGLITGGIPDRILSVMRYVKSCSWKHLQIELADPITEFSPLIERLVRMLVDGGAVLSERKYAAQGAAGSALRAFQDGADRARKKDSGIVILRTTTDAEAARHALLRIEGSDVWVFDPARTGRLFSETLRQAGMGDSARTQASSAHPAAVLRAALALLWEPFDIEAAVVFLSLPLSPLPRFAAMKLLRTLESQPGISGERWNEAIEALSRSPDVRETLNRLFLDPRLDPSAASVHNIEETAKWIRDWARRGLEKEPDLGLANGAAAQFLRLISREKGPISRLRVEQLLALAIPREAGTEREAGSAVFFSNPGELIAPADTLVLWNFTADAIWRPPIDFWTDEERSIIQAAGGNLADRTALAASQNRRLRRMISQARTLIVCAPESTESQPVGPHPWLERLRPYATIDHRRTMEDAGGHLAEIPPALPVPVGPWRLTSPIPVPERWSHSRLGNLLYSPPDFALSQLHMNGSPFFSVRGVKMLHLGNTLHRLLERALGERRPAEWSEGDFHAWIERETPGTVQETAAHFLLPVFHADLSDIKKRARHLWNLIQTLGRVSGEVRSEVELNGNVGGHTFTGKADVVIDARPPVILDLKPGGYTKRREEMENGRSLQLHIYSELLANGACEIGYFLADRSHLLTTARLPDGIHLSEPPGAHEAILSALGQQMDLRIDEATRGVIQNAISEGDYRRLVKDGAWPDVIPFGCYPDAAYAGFRGELI